MNLFHTSSEGEIKQGGTTDVYFVRTKQVLEARSLEKTHVTLSSELSLQIL
jgi:nicotinic acid phosphoribosyltransferase